MKNNQKLMIEIERVEHRYILRIGNQPSKIYPRFQYKNGLLPELIQLIKEEFIWSESEVQDDE
jgi:hypothetical protein